MLKKDLFEKLPDINYNKLMNILLLTHTDLDGSGAYVVLCSLINIINKNINVDVKHCSNNTMSSNIFEAIKENYNNHYYSFIIATDISVNEEHAEEIDREYKDDANFIILDHHKSALYLNKYSWAVVQPELIDDSFRADYYKNIDESAQKSSSGTSLMYDFIDYSLKLDDKYEAFNYINKISLKYLLQKFVHNVATYDTFDWKKTFNSNESFRELNILFEAYGQNLFEKTFINFFKGNIPYDIFKANNDMLIKIEKEKKENYLASVKQAGFIDAELTDDENIYSVCIWPDGKYLPYIFDLMKQEKPEADIYAIYFFSGKNETVSLRSDKIDLSVFAKKYGGGGHPGAAGFPVSKEKQFSHISDLFNDNLSVYMEGY